MSSFVPFSRRGPNDKEECCGESACCGNDSNVDAHDHDHGHGHGHDHSSSAGGCRAGTHSDVNDYSHDHGHGHTHDFEETACGDEDCGCSHDAAATPNSSSLDHSHGHAHDEEEPSCSDSGYGCHAPAVASLDHHHCHSHSPSLTASATATEKATATAAATAATVITSTTTLDIAGLMLQVNTHTSEICTSCDPLSSVPHAMSVTRIRIANLCCAMEERIVIQSLKDQKGIESVSVNTIGRYAMVTHCPVVCCTPASRIVDILNAERLGASLQEAGDEDEGDAKESLDWPLIAFVSLTLAVFFCGVGAQEATTGQGSQSLASTVLFLVGTSLGTAPILYSCHVAIRRRALDIHCLIVLAVAGALVSREYLDACLIVALFNAAGCIEGIVMKFVRDAVQGSSARLPRRCFLVEEAAEEGVEGEEGEEREGGLNGSSSISVGKEGSAVVGSKPLGAGKSVPVEGLRRGDVVACRAGDMILVDGRVRKGDGVVDESALTGEARPISKRKGDSVTSGSVVQNGYLEIIAEKSYRDSSVCRLLEAVSAVQADKSAVSRLVDVFAAYWTPGVLVFTLLFVLIGGGVTSGASDATKEFDASSSSENTSAGAKTGWYYYTSQGIILLVLACPCSIVIATPIPAVCAIAAAARNGILIRGSAIIEKLAAITTLAIDKTGTLTSGFFSEQGRLLLPGRTNEEVFPLAAALEEKSAHPLAQAVMSAVHGCIGEYQEALKSGGALPSVKQVKVIDGVGIGGWVSPDGNQTNWLYVHCGNERLLTRKLVRPLSARDSASVAAFRAAHPTASVIYIAIDDELSALLALADAPRPESSTCVTACKSLGLEVCMLTGDERGAALDVCRRVGIDADKCWSRMLPEGKLGWVREAQLDQAASEEGKKEVGGLDNQKKLQSAKAKAEEEQVGVIELALSPSPLQSLAAQAQAAAPALAPATAVAPETSELQSLLFEHEQGQRGPQGGRRVLMLGDGINDATALACAWVGAAMGSGGSAMAVSAADLVLLSNNLLRVPQAVALCRLTRRVMLFNCSFSVGIKLIAVALALAGQLALWAAILVDVGTLVVVVIVGTAPLFVRTEAEPETDR